MIKPDRVLDRFDNIDTHVHWLCEKLTADETQQLLTMLAEHYSSLVDEDEAEEEIHYILNATTHTIEADNCTVDDLLHLVVGIVGMIREEVAPDATPEESSAVANPTIMAVAPEGTIKRIRGAFNRALQCERLCSKEMTPKRRDEAIMASVAFDEELAGIVEIPKADDWAYRYIQNPRETRLTAWNKNARLLIAAALIEFTLGEGK